MRKKITALCRNRRGTTLVELIVTFALIGLFVVAATGALVSSLRIFYRSRQSTNAQSVSDILLDRIEGELAGASAGNIIISTTDPAQADKQFSKVSVSDTFDGDKACFVLAASGACIYYIDSQGAPVYIMATPYDPAVADSGNLILHYYPLGVHSATDWHYDPDTLLRFRIRSLSFTRVPDSASEPNYVVQIDLTLVSIDGNYEYTSRRTVDCFRLRNSGTRTVIKGYIDTDDYHVSRTAGTA